MATTTSAGTETLESHSSRPPTKATVSGRNTLLDGNISAQTSLETLACRTGRFEWFYGSTATAGHPAHDGDCKKIWAEFLCRPACEYKSSWNQDSQHHRPGAGCPLRTQDRVRRKQHPRHGSSLYFTFGRQQQRHQLHHESHHRQRKQEKHGHLPVGIVQQHHRLRKLLER